MKTDREAPTHGGRGPFSGGTGIDLDRRPLRFGRDNDKSDLPTHLCNRHHSVAPEMNAPGSRANRLPADDPSFALAPLRTPRVLTQQGG